MSLMGPSRAAWGTIMTRRITGTGGHGASAPARPGPSSCLFHRISSDLNPGQAYDRLPVQVLDTEAWLTGCIARAEPGPGPGLRRAEPSREWYSARSTPPSLSHRGRNGRLRDCASPGGLWERRGPGRRPGNQSCQGKTWPRHLRLVTWPQLGTDKLATWSSHLGHFHRVCAQLA